MKKLDLPFWISVLGLLFAFLALIRDITDYTFTLENLSTIIERKKYLLIIISGILGFLIGRYFNGGKKNKINLFLGTGDDFERNETYKCICTIFNPDKDIKKEKEVSTRWEAGNLAITLDGVKLQELVSVKLEIPRSGKKWECDFFYPQNTECNLNQM